MENEIFAPILENFMSSPLVIWIKTFGTLLRGTGTLLDEYVALIDGVFLNEVMFQMEWIFLLREIRVDLADITYIWMP